MFALANNQKLVNKFGNEMISKLVSSPNKADSYELSPSLCKIYENRLKIDFFNRENKNFLHFHYISPQELNNKETKLTLDRYLSYDPNIISLFNSQQAKSSRLNFKLNAYIDRLTISLNDDNILSASNQIEILRLTSRGISACLKRFSLSPSSSSLMNVQFKCRMLQLDNQMFENEDDIEPVLGSAQQFKYDFPVIFIPRDEFKSSAVSKFTKSYDQLRASINNSAIFLDVKVFLSFLIIFLTSKSKLKSL